MLQFHITVGDDDGVIDIGAHLDGADHQIAEEEQGLILQIGEREVDPHAALDDQNQQDGQSGGLEGEHQHQHHEDDGQNTDEQVVVAEGGGQVEVTGGVSHQKGVLLVVPAHHAVEGVQEGEGLPALLRQVQLEDQAAVLLALQLELGVRQLDMEVLNGLGHIAVQRDIALLHHIVNVEEHVDQGHAITVDTGDHLAVALLVHGVSGVQQPGQLNVQIRHFGELPGGQPVGEDIAVHGIHIGKAQNGVGLRHPLQFPEQAALLLIVPLGNQHG